MGADTYNPHLRAAEISVLDWVAGWMQARIPGLSWSDARKMVMCAMAGHREGRPLSHTEQEIVSAWELVK